VPQQTSDFPLEAFGRLGLTWNNLWKIGQLNKTESQIRDLFIVLKDNLGFVYWYSLFINVGQTGIKCLKVDRNHYSSGFSHFLGNSVLAVELEAWKVHDRLGFIC